MTKAELEKQLEEQKKIIEKQKRRIKNQNEKAKENWDTVSCRLPKGTKSRITQKGLTVNGFINSLVIAELDRLEADEDETLHQTAPEAAESPETLTGDDLPMQEQKPENKPIKDDKTEAEKIAEVQAMIDAKKAEEAERKRQAEERKAQAERERQEQLKNTLNSVVEDIKAKKENRRKEDKEKFKQITDDFVTDLLQDAAFFEWLEKIGFDNALEPLAEEMGVNNAEIVINAAKEQKRKESINKANIDLID